MTSSFLNATATATAPAGKRHGHCSIRQTRIVALSATKRSRLVGRDGSGSAEVIPFEPDEQLATLQTTGLSLEREKALALEDVRPLFADRIVVTCD